MKKPIIVVDKNGPSGNVFSIIGKAIRLLEIAGKDSISKELENKALDMMKKHCNYEDLCNLVSEYVQIEWIEG